MNRQTLLLLLGWMLPLWLVAQEFPEPEGFVNDYKLLFTPEQRSELDAFLTDFAQTTSNEIAVVTINLPPSETKEVYTTDMAHAWGIGSKKNDNGVLLAVYPNTREVFISVGYGLEGALPDIVIKGIIDQYMLPAFRSGDYYGGVKQATEIMTGIVKGEYDDAPLRKNYYDRPRGGDRKKVPDEVILLFIIVLILILINLNKGKGGGGNSGRRGRGYHRGGAYWWGTGGGSWGGGGGSSWGGGGGGFGGFGGGGFGGGGAGGSW